MTARTARVWLIALVALFVAVRLPLLGDYTWHHADEYLYTDAAIRMLEAGDPSTPRYADGTLRFNKPLLTYWVVAASFAAGGIGLAASRLPFLLAAALLALLTFRIAERALDDREAALLAVAILLAHPETAELATRATPDMLLCLFVAACLYGFVRLLLDVRPPASAAYWAWGGMGLAVATKGIAGALAFGWGTAVLAVSRGIRPLLAPGAIALGGVLAGAGIASAWLRHGDTALVGLFADQVKDRTLRASWWDVVRSFVGQLGAIVTALLPWTALLAIGGRTSLDGAARHAALARFGIGFAVLMAMASAQLAFVRPRYVAPATPLLAIVCAGVLAAVARRRAAPGVVARVLVGLAAVVGVGLALLGLRVSGSWVAAGVAIAAGGVVGMRRARAGLAPMTALAGMMVLTAGLLDAVVRPSVHQSPAPALAACLLARGPAAFPIATVGEVNTIPADLRLASGGRLDVTMVPDIPRLQADGREYATLVAPGGVAGRLETLGWRLAPCGHEVRRLERRDWLALLRTGSFGALRIDQSRAFFLATRP